MDGSGGHDSEEMQNRAPPHGLRWTPIDAPFGTSLLLIQFPVLSNVRGKLHLRVPWTTYAASESCWTTVPFLSPHLPPPLDGENSVVLMHPRG